MNKKAFIFILMAVLTIFGLGSCLAKTSLDWAGVYTGTIPSAGGSGIDVRLKINKDETFELSYKYLDRPPENSFISTGSFKWDDGNTITLDIKDTPSHYKVAKNKLIQLDMSGKPITGNLADNYVLTKGN
jgi:uncharacterized lipoprotein NlpE involved in copper resistance